ncbi:MAG: HDOD domain-containing protein [Opitutaceae bacterium]|nr:HDOD domain-containing protein [Opitutaceae bacterium]
MSAAATVTTPPQFTRENLLRIARGLPADVGVIAKLGTMLQDPNSDLDDLSALLRRDVALSTRIVRISNSASYSAGTGRVASIDQAVSRVGFGEVLKLVGNATAARFTELTLDVYGIPGKDLRNNMLYAALATEALARPAGIDPRIAYTAGLLRPLGIMVLDYACRNYPELKHRYAPNQWQTYAAWEGTTLCLDSCQVAAFILEDLGFPEDITSAIRVHYLTRPEDFNCRLATLLNVANGLAARVSYSFQGETQWWELNQAKLDAAGIGLDDFEPAIMQIEEKFEAALAAIAA